MVSEPSESTNKERLTVLQQYIQWWLFISSPAASNNCLMWQADSVRNQLKELLSRFGIAIQRGDSALMIGLMDSALALAYNHHQSVRLDFDFILRDFLMSRGTPDGVSFLQIGAFDGVTSDPLHEYVVEHDWEGLLVEPQSYYFRQLRETYANEDGLQFVQAAIDHENGFRTLYTVDTEVEDVPESAGGLASFDRDVLLSHSDIIPELNNMVVEKEVKTYNLMSIINEYSLDPDIIQIDTEGFDYEVLSMINFEKIYPKIIHFENKHLSKGYSLKASKYLISNGYRIAKSNVDTVAYRRL